MPTLWVKHKEVIKLNPSEAEITGQISAGVNQARLCWGQWNKPSLCQHRLWTGACHCVQSQTLLSAMKLE